MINQKPYDVYIDNMKIPVTPAEIERKVDSKNDFYDLINGNTYTAIRKAEPEVWEFSFFALSGKHPCVDTHISQEQIEKKLKDLKEEKKAFEFVVIRSSSNADLSDSYINYVTLEDFDIKEDARWNTNIMISLSLKEYQPLETATLKECGFSAGVRKMTEVTVKNTKKMVASIMGKVNLTKAKTAKLDTISLKEPVPEKQLSTGMLTDDVIRKLR